jgi:hypothetical protein
VCRNGIDVTFTCCAVHIIRCRPTPEACQTFIDDAVRWQMFTISRFMVQIQLFNRSSLSQKLNLDVKRGVCAENGTVCSIVRILEPAWILLYLKPEAASSALELVAAGGEPSIIWPTTANRFGKSIGLWRQGTGNNIDREFVIANLKYEKINDPFFNFAGHWYGNNAGGFGNYGYLLLHSLVCSP